MRRGFTLIELVLVLAILSLLSVLAMRELGKGQSEFRYRKSEETLADIKDAIRRFAADTGRLPRARSYGNDESRLTLAELFVRPPELPEAGLCVSNGVKLTVGWNGPYLRRGGAYRDGFVTDGWGNEFAAYAYGSPGFSPSTALVLPHDDFVAATNAFDGTHPYGASYTNGFEIGYVRFLGADGIEEMDPVRLFSVTNDPSAFLNRDASADDGSTCMTNVFVRSVHVVGADGFTIYAPDPFSPSARMKTYRQSRGDLWRPSDGERLTVGWRAVVVDGGPTNYLEFSENTRVMP